MVSGRFVTSSEKERTFHRLRFCVLEEVFSLHGKNMLALNQRGKGKKHIVEWLCCLGSSINYRR